MCAFLPLADQAFAKDERSIRNLGKALTGLSSDVDPKEAELVSITAHTTARKLARDYHVVLNPEFQAFLVNVGARKRGWCGHWAQDIGTQLKELQTQDASDSLGASPTIIRRAKINCLVVTARNQPFTDGIILVWLGGGRGRLFWCPVVKDGGVTRLNSITAISGIPRHEKENMQWSAGRGRITGTGGKRSLKALAREG